MEGSLNAASCMAAFAVSGSVVLLALRVHKSLMSDFMKKIEFEFGLVKGESNKKRVRFAEEVEEFSPSPSCSSSENGSGDNHRRYKKHLVVVSGRKRGVDDDRRFESMPENWQALYKGIIKYRALKGCI